MRNVAAFLASIALLYGCSAVEPDSFTVPADYKTWKKPVDGPLAYPVPGHGRTFRYIYGNDICYKAAYSRDRNGYNRVIMPAGSIIIKEVYTTRKDINKRDPLLTIMVRNDTSPAAQQGWLYYVRKPGKRVTRVDTKMCIGCHEAANEPHIYFDKNTKGIFRDYLFSLFVR
jgi:hypothetical protein